MLRKEKGEEFDFERTKKKKKEIDVADMLRCVINRFIDEICILSSFIESTKPKTEIILLYCVS